MSKGVCAFFWRAVCRVLGLDGDSSRSLTDAATGLELASVDEIILYLPEAPEPSENEALSPEGSWDEGVGKETRGRGRSLSAVKLPEAGVVCGDGITKGFFTDAP